MKIAFFRLPRQLLFCSLACCAALVPSPLRAATYDLAASFSPTNNPNPPWAYGWEGTIGGMFAPYTSHLTTTDQNGLPADIWESSSSSAIYFNPTSQTEVANGGASQLPPHSCWWLPGVPGQPDNFGAIRFTVPLGQSGLYAISVQLAPAINNSSQGSTYFYLVKNGVQTFGQYLAAGQSLTLTNSLALQAGDNVDFLLGRGTNATSSGDVVKVEAILSQVSGSGVSDLNADFSTNSNPNGVWTYGWKTTLGGPLTAFTGVQLNPTDNGVPIEALYYQIPQPPNVFHNSTTNTAMTQGGAGTYPPGTTWFVAGLDNSTQNFGAIRYTVPAGGDGVYALSTAVTSYLNGPISGDTDFHVVWNGNEIFGQFLPGNAGTNFGGIIALSGGDTIDFLTGRGADGHLSASGLKITATIAPTNGVPTITPNFPLGTNAIHDLSVDFSTNSNPKGPWTYGYESVIGGPLTTYSNSATSTGDNSAAFESWSLPGLSPSAVYHNASSNTVLLDGGAGVFPPGSTWFVPGLDGGTDNFGAIRFTVPAGGSGSYVLQTAVQPYLSGPFSGDSDFHILTNGIEIFGEFLSPTTGTGYTNLVSLFQGETIDFLVGRGADGHFAGSGLLIQAQIEAPTLIINPPGGYFTNQVTVTIQSFPGDTTILYTVDGSAPTNNSTVYSGPFILTSAATVNAQAYLGGQPFSPIVSETYARVYVTNNLIPASWLITYFGSNYLTNPNAAPTADPDGDGQDNYQEYLAGTNPLDPNSFLHIGSIYTAPVIAWPSVTNVTYVIQREFINTTNWVNIATNKASGTLSIFVDTSVTSTNSYIYRLAVFPP